MDVTSEELLGLFSLLRSSNTVENQSADDQLKELIKNPNTIFALFALLDETKDETLRHHAYIMLGNCFRYLKSDMNESFYIQFREQILQLLQNEPNTQCIETLITVVQILIDPDIPWPEIIQFVFSIDYNESPKSLFLALSIFNGLIDTLSSDIILENQEGLMNLVFSGLNSDIQNLKYINLAITFLYNLYVAFQNKTPNQIPDGSVFQERLLEIFNYSVESSDINYFIHISEPILIGYEKNIFIFPAIEAMPKILQTLQTEQLDAIFRLTVHYFFITTFSIPIYSSVLDEESLKLLFDIESYITGLIVSSSEEIDANNWFDDIFNGLSIIYIKMEPQEAVSFTMTQGQNLLSEINMSDPGSISTICFALLIFLTCIYHFQENISDEQLDVIYQAFLDAMNSHVSILMSLSGNILLDLFKNFEKIINYKYISPTLSSILIYLDEVTKDDLLLYSFVKILDNCDPIFCNLIETCLQLINSGPTFAQYSAYFVIGECIDRSDCAAYEFFDQLYSHFLEIIKTPQEFVQMPHFLVLIDLTSLINLVPSKIESIVDEFLVPVLTAFHNSKDQLLIQNVLTVLNCISNHKNLLKVLDSQYYELMVNDFPRLIQKDWKQKIENSLNLDIKFQKVIQKFVNASHSLEILSRFTMEYKQFVVENTIMNYFPPFFQALKIICEHFNEIDCTSIFNALILIIGNSSFAERGSIKQKEELDGLKEQAQMNSDEGLMEQIEEKKMIFDLYSEEIEICKSLYQDVIYLLDLTKDENTASYLLIVIKLLISNKCIDEDQFEGIINLTLKVIKSFTNSSICIFQLSHIVNEISKRIDFDAVCGTVIPFITQLFSDEDKPKQIIDAINFIKNLEELSLDFLQKPEISEFWQSIPDLIADPSNNKEIASAVIKMMATVCQKVKREEVLPLIFPLLESSKKRLVAELPFPSELRDNLAAYLAILGGSVIGDDFPFSEILPLILSAIPLQCDFTLCTELYQFISGIFKRVIINDEQLKNLYVHGLVELFSQPYKKIEIMNIDPYVLNSLQTSLYMAFKNNEDDEDDDEQFMTSILQILEGDQDKYSTFAQTYARIQSFCISNIQWA